MICRLFTVCILMFSLGLAALAAPTAQEYLQDGDALTGQQKYAEAVVAYMAAWMQEPENAAIPVKIGEAWQAAGQLERAAAFYRTAVKLDGASIAAVSALGWLYVDQGKAKEAIALLEPLKATFRTEGEWYYLLGNAYLKAARYADAEATLRAGIAAAPEKSALYGDLGNSLYYLKRYREAAALYATALQKNPADATAALNRSYALESAGDMADAAKALELYLQLAGAEAKADERKRLLALQGRAATLEATTPPPAKTTVPVLPAPWKEPLGGILYGSAGMSRTVRHDVKAGTIKALPFLGDAIALSPDRKKLAYLGKRDKLHIYNLETGKDIQLIDDDTRITVASPTFVGNETLAFLKENRMYEAEVCLTPITGYEERAWPGGLPEGTLAGSATLRWIPGSDPAAPSFVVCNVRGIFVTRPDGLTSLVQIDPKTGVSLRYPAVNPDGRSVVYVRDAGENSLWSIAIDGKNMRQLIKTDGTFPTWSPDGQYLAFLTHAAAERGLLKRDIYNAAATSRGAGFFLFGIGIIKRDGSPVKSLCGTDGKPAHTSGDYLAWQ
jgi:tetratricopeptide (TPR) repeat protein